MCLVIVHSENIVVTTPPSYHDNIHKQTILGQIIPIEYDILTSMTKGANHRYRENDPLTIRGKETK